MRNAEAITWSERLENESNGRTTKEEDPISLIRKKLNSVVTTLNVKGNHAEVQSTREEQAKSSERVLAIGKAMAAKLRLA